MWELRIVIWDCDKVQCEGDLDLFFTVEFQCSHSDKSSRFSVDADPGVQRAVQRQGGRGEFNYRFKFPVQCRAGMPRMR